MDPLAARIVVAAALVASIALRAPHARASEQLPVAQSRRSGRERLLLLLVGIGFFAPLPWIVSPALAFADYPLHPAAFAAGCVLLVAGLWLFHRSHVDLGRQWSVTLELREGHRLVTSGVYSRVRHPMYTSILLHAAGQALALPNWVAGPAFLVGMSLLVAFRLGAEERMLRDAFGPEWDAYAARTHRLVPGVV